MDEEYDNEWSIDNVDGEAFVSDNEQHLNDLEELDTSILWENDYRD